MRIFILLQLVFSFSIIANAQPCSGPGRSPDNAQAVCGYIPFNEKIVSNCTGPDIPNPTSGCGQVTSDNSVWYKFHCFVSGNFGFLLTPANATDDYDWEIIDITGHPPGDVYTTELRVSLNLSGQPGVTGCSAAGTSDINCGGGAPGTQYNRLLNLVAGRDYLMMVNNWTSSTQGYNLVFSGTASLVDPANPAPLITNVSMVGCDASKVKVTFSEDILCSSISPINLLSEFSITAGTHPIAALISDCMLNANGIPYVIINLQTPLTPGNYQLNVSNGSDGTTLENACKIQMAPISFPFTVAAIAPTAVNNITYSGCAPTVLKVKLTKPVFCSSITFSGSNGEFMLQPGNILPLTVQGVCSGTPAYADLINVTFQNPIPFGNYQLVIANGPDGNTFKDTCGNDLIATSVPFAINQTTVAPIVQTIGFDECHPDKIVVNFDKPVRCGSVSTDEFTVTPGPLAIANVTYNCIGNPSYITQAIITMQNPLPAGNFAVNIKNGIDGNSLSDTCFAYIANGYTKAFTTTKAPLPKFDSVQFDKCNPSFVKLFYSNAIKCSSVSTDGSDYNITGPSAVTISSAVTDGNCATLGYTKWVQLQFAQPVNVFGNYVVHNKISPVDANGIIDTCSAIQDIAETIGFTALVKPTAAFTSQVKFGCTMDTIILTHPGGNGITSWTWLFPDGSTGTGQTITRLFPVSTPSVTIQLTVDNGSCNDVVSQTITLGNAFNAQFDAAPNDTVCINAPLTFTNTSPGNNLQYVWDFGDNTPVFAGQTPPPHAYTTSGTYNVKMRATDPYGCWDEAGGIFEILPAATIDFTGLSPQYCSDKTISLTKVSSNTISTYTWDDGDGMTVQNKPTVQFTYPKEGVYTITLTGTDKYCGTAVATKQVQIYAVPVVNIGNDTILCPAMTLQIGPSPINGYTYLWSNGATTSQISTDLLTANYSLQVNNNGCTASDAISVKVLTACLIMVPNAFTPNNDGNNDKLKPTNADLAKEFSFKVFNRYGELMFSTTNPTEGWDGMRRGVRVDAGTYVWQLRYVDPWNLKKVVQNGTSILLR